MSIGQKKSEHLPLWKKRIRLFWRNKRASISLVLLFGILILSLCAELIANDKPLALIYKGEWHFPIIKTYTEQTFGGDFPTSADYKDEVISKNISQNGKAWFPIIPYSFNTVDYALTQPTPSAPDKHHWLGTDDEGRDILARILYGIRLSIVFAFILTAAASTIGIIVGAGIFRRENRHHYSAFFRNLGIFAAAFYPDYYRKRLCTRILDTSVDYAGLWVDIIGRRCPRRISAHAEF